MKRLPGLLHEYKSIDDVVGSDKHDSITYTSEFLNSLSPAGLPPHNFRLKERAIVVLLRKLDVKNGLCNGTRLIATHFGRLIDNHTEKGVSFRLRRRQFPVLLAYAMTINKAQGQSLTSVGVHLEGDVFSMDNSTLPSQGLGDKKE
ncbi:hypothetical protein ANCCAN_22641 [Ancylostoma caninum]|uniref:DNA helicase Pif1-like 2B domain-containing protein n=1 Tax=Ancylostoma caninum TaxID=29170 RepID=A0A368FH56_ANCCA|nr:hypothetical protein ANCCAN_22641 [Ancylostoma caninum]